MYDPVFLFLSVEKSDLQLRSSKFLYISFGKNIPLTLMKTSSNMSLQIQIYSLEHLSDQFRMYVCVLCNLCKIYCYR